jgi:Family of unknown function (DUF6496)
LRRDIGHLPCTFSAFIDIIGGPMAKYGKTAQRKVKRAMHERKRGTLKSGGSGKKVTSRKQAIAIGLSEARRAGGKVPRKGGGRKRKGGGGRKKGGSRTRKGGGRKAR